PCGASLPYRFHASPLERGVLPSLGGVSDHRGDRFARPVLLTGAVARSRSSFPGRKGAHHRRGRAPVPSRTTGEGAGAPARVRRLRPAFPAPGSLTSGLFRVNDIPIS